MKRRVSPIGDVLKQVFSEIEKRQEISEDEISGLWATLVGEVGFKHSKPERLKKKVLTVWVDNSVWLQDLTLRKHPLLKGLKRALGKDRISEIRFKIGEF